MLILHLLVVLVWHMSYSGLVYSRSCVKGIYVRGREYKRKRREMGTTIFVGLV